LIVVLLLHSTLVFPIETVQRWTAEKVLKHEKGIVGDEPEYLDDRERKTLAENGGKKQESVGRTWR